MATAHRVRAQNCRPTSKLDAPPSSHLRNKSPMGNGKAFLLIAGTCWVALLLNVLGSFIKRFAAIRKLGTLIQWQAFAIYLLGLAGTAAVLFSAREREGWAVIAVLVGVFTFVPLGACTVQFYKAATKRGAKPAEWTQRVS
jgi:hypothetical protein